MEIAISERLKNDFINKGEKCTLLKIVSKFDKDYTPKDFINKMIDNINSFYKININHIDNIEDISTTNYKDMYICIILDKNETWGEFVITASDKWGNTIISQQLTSFLLQKLNENPNYLFNKIKKFVYLTMPLDDNKDLPLTKRLVLSAVETLGYDVVRAISGGALPEAFTNVNEILDFVNKSKNKNTANTSSSLLLRKSYLENDTLRLTIKGNIGQSSKYYALILLAIYRLNRVRFEYSLDDNVKPDKIINQIQELFNEKVKSQNYNMEIRESFNEYSVSNDKLSQKLEKNVIFYGVPGTGKSYRVKKLIEENSIPDEDVFRATLHPEFSYSDFVGQILPDVDAENVPTYKYQPGIFTKALERALKVDDPVLLILEEMSRANVAAVFGDIFQLLDRDQSGKSDYGIDNDLIYNHLDEKARANLDSKKIKIPENLYIVGTVNTSDQNVFPMDNAFKRRFSWKYVSIEIPDDENNPELTIKVGKGDQVTEYSVKWSELLFKLNEFIVNREKGLSLTEDKQLGPYFIKFDDISDTKRNDELIKNKLLQYLWDDVQNSMAAFGNASITLFDKSIHSFSGLYECYDKQQIFSNKFLGEDYLNLSNQEADNHEE